MGKTYFFLFLGDDERYEEGGEESVEEGESSHQEDS